MAFLSGNEGASTTEMESVGDVSPWIVLVATLLRTTGVPRSFPSVLFPKVSDRKVAFEETDGALLVLLRSASDLSNEPAGAPSTKRLMLQLNDRPCNETWIHTCQVCLFRKGKITNLAKFSPHYPGGAP